MKKKKIVFKSPRDTLQSWIIDNFPPNYQKLTYIEPFCESTNVILNKESSKDEVLNSLDSTIVNMLHVIRDQCDELIDGINKVKCKEKDFKLAVIQDEFSNNVESAVNEIVLRKMSHRGLKKTFTSKSEWGNITDELVYMSHRLECVYIFKRHFSEIIKSFNMIDAFLYVYPTTIDIDESLKLGNLLNSFKGKVLVSCESSVLYNRLFKSWKIVRNPNKKEILWRNY